jgi:hypothetical protein
MPRGQEKSSGVRSAVLGSEVMACRWSGRQGVAVEEPRAAIKREVTEFAWAWFAGDAQAMMRCLHPEFVNRLMRVRDGGPRPCGDAEGLVLSELGLQGTLGGKIAPDRRSLEVRVLDVRPRSASALALLAGWALHVHLARAGVRWSIVNAMWEMSSG